VPSGWDGKQGHEDYHGDRKHIGVHGRRREVQALDLPNNTDMAGVMAPSP